MNLETPTTEFERQEIEEKLYKRAQNFSEENPRIDPQAFYDLYNSREIKKDLDEIADLEKKFIEQRKQNPELARWEKLAETFEALVIDQIERSDWLGENAMTVRASRFDDVKNGVDLIVEFSNESSHLALAIDVTTSGELSKKFLRIEEEISDDKLTLIKYYSSENFRGELKNIPRIVIGADKNTIINIGELWLNKDNNALARHPMQKIILAEIIIQLRAFSNYAEKNGKNNAASAYRRSLKIIEKILADKKTTPQSSYDDGVCRAIIDQCKNFSL